MTTPFTGPRSAQRRDRRTNSPRPANGSKSPLPPNTPVLQGVVSVSEIARQGAKILDFNGLSKDAHRGKPTRDGKRPLCIREALTQATPAGMKDGPVIDEMHTYVKNQGFGGMAAFTDDPRTGTAQAVAMVYDFAAYAARRDARQGEAEVAA